jgi:metal-sulfur cluster biosynthetic enzyme
MCRASKTGGARLICLPDPCRLERTVKVATEVEIYDALREVYDPEIGINVVDLGLIYGVKAEGERVDVEMTLTTPGCPMRQMLGQAVGEAVESLPGVKDVYVRIVWEPRWTKERLSASAKQQLGLA